MQQKAGNSGSTGTGAGFGVPPMGVAETGN